MFRDKDDTRAQQGGYSWSSARFSDHSLATNVKLHAELELSASVRAPPRPSFPQRCSSQDLRRQLRVKDPIRSQSSMAEMFIKVQ